MMQKRFIELDILRGIAILLMIIYHAAFDLVHFYGWQMDIFDGLWWLLARSTATLFLLLVGITSAISYDRSTHRNKHLRRFAMVGSGALVVSISTYIADPTTYVRFGILHLIAVSGLLLPLFVRRKDKTPHRGVSTHGDIGMVIPALFLFLIDPFLDLIRLDTSLLLPLGIKPINFQTLDYFPLIPWFGVIMIGYAIGRLFYVQYTHWRSFLPSLKANSYQLTALTFPGRHSLALYLIHQPVMLGILWMTLGSWKG